MISLLPATPEDASVLSDIAMCSKAHWGYDSTFMNACRDELTQSPEKLASSSFHFVVAKNHGVIVGFYCVQWLEKARCELEALFIHPDHMGCGVGKQLMLDAIKIAKARGCERMQIDSDPNAKAFYLSFGAKLVREVPSASIPGRTLPQLEIHLR